jgi:hypothetical protein
MITYALIRQGLRDRRFLTSRLAGDLDKKRLPFARVGVSDRCAHLGYNKIVCNPTGKLLLVQFRGLDPTKTRRPSTIRPKGFLALFAASAMLPGIDASSGADVATSY